MRQPGKAGRHVKALADQYAQATIRKRAAVVDRMMIWLLAAEWLGMMVTAFIVSPRVWNGDQSGLHPHVWAAILAGPLFILPAIAIALLNPARQATRHVLAVAQMVVSILLIDVTGGRIETHFHIFGSIAILAFYMDWRVLATATAVTGIDHLTRGLLWPQSVYGVLTASPWRSAEHVWWVTFEDFFLLLAARQSMRDLKAAALGNARLYWGASHDVLTGLANRRLLQERFDAWVDSRPGAASAILYVDLDRFKQANDVLGHAVGDRLLALVASRFRAFAGPGVTLARVGGDEFVFFRTEIGSPDGANAMGQKVLDSLAPPFNIDGHEVLLSASVGIGLYPEHGTTLRTLQDNADRAMFAAKSRGRNHCEMFSPIMLQRHGTVQEIARDLSLAMSRREFHLVYQPLVRGLDGQLNDCEALLRWHHPVHGNIPPSEFIPLAEESGMVVSLGDWVLTQACLACASWQRPGYPAVAVSVNVSAEQFDQSGYAEKILRILDDTGLSPSLLILELTEGILARDIPRTRAQLARIRDAGIRVALDDFGVGYSSLSYLAELPADRIKLDRTFLNRELLRSTAIIESVVQLAHRLGMQVVAEGIETNEQRERLLALGCDVFQGYYFSRPIPAAEVSALLIRTQPESSVAGELEALNEAIVTASDAEVSQITSPEPELVA